MIDTEPLDLDALEARLDAGFMPEPGERVKTTRALIAEVRRLREAMQSALDDIEGYGGDILWKALHPEEDGA